MPGDERSSKILFNHEAARIFRELASLLRLQDGNPFRINAYIRAASTLESLEGDARDILREQGIDGLTRLPTIGSGLASSIEEIARTGRLSQLDRLRGSADPDRLFRSVPGVGEVLSRRIHDALHVDTLEALELAAHDGRLASVPGIGARRVEAIKAAIASMLGRAGGPRPYRREAPPVQLLLDVDAEYRDKASRNALPKLAPKRFNPQGEAWLPVLHAARPPWHFTALYSNTARAHELGRTHDWVVVYFYDDDHREGQCTIVTESHGEQRGRRVVRGRERECGDAYASGYSARAGSAGARGSARNRPASSSNERGLDT
jgi:DNA polymerase (family X)